MAKTSRSNPPRARSGADEGELLIKSDLKPIQPDQLNLDLFELDPLRDQNFSNTLEIYDLAGKFRYDKKKKYLKSAAAEDIEFKRVVSYKGEQLDISVTAANIERVSKTNGAKQRVFVFPGAREEIIEDVLRKFATERRAQAYQTANTPAQGGHSKFVGLEFTLYEVDKELRRVGRTYSYPEIEEALEIMHRAFLSIRSASEGIDVSAPFFPIMAKANTNKPGDRRLFVCFHPMVTDVTLALGFRRYNYLKEFEFQGHYTRLLYKRLCHRWVQAGPGRPYTIMLSTLIDAMKTPAGKLFQDKVVFEQVLKDLVEKDILARYEATPRKEGKKIVDWQFRLHASETFSKQMAANNKAAEKLTRPRPTQTQRDD